MSTATPQTERRAVKTAAPPKRRVALVSGASRGIGSVTAVALARAGFDVAVIARDKARLDDVRSQIAALGVRAFAAECDVTDAASVDAAVHAVVAALGPPAVVVNNALARSPSSWPSFRSAQPQPAWRPYSSWMMS